jgi:RNA polymerase sigma factor (sigma-70 family)
VPVLHHASFTAPTSFQSPVRPSSVQNAADPRIPRDGEGLLLRFPGTKFALKSTRNPKRAPPAAIIIAFPCQPVPGVKCPPIRKTHGEVVSTPVVLATFGVSLRCHGQFSRPSSVYPCMDDAMALQQIMSKDNSRIAAAVAEQGPRLRAFVRRQVADLSEVDDIVQETFLELVSAYRLLQPVEHLAAWLLRVARNRIIDRFRARSRQASPGEASGRDSVGSAVEPSRVLEQWLAADDGGPESAYVRGVLADELIAAVDELPAEQRDVFLAHELDGRSFKQLRAETGIGINTLLGRKHAAVRHLRRRLEDIRSEFDI